MPVSMRNWDRIAPLLVVAIFAVVYACTLDTGLQPGELYGGDLITHQYAQVQARPSNAPGYPLYTMGGWLWFHGGRALLAAIGDVLPNPTPILSSYSTLWALLALWLFYLVLDRLWVRRDQVAVRRLTTLLLTSFLGVTYFFWYYATTTEQYSSAIAQTLAIVYVYLRWLEDKSRLRWLYGLALLCGISLAHMLTVAFIVPPLVLAVLWQQPRLLLSPRAIIGAIVAAAAPLLSYLYVYLRGAFNPQWWGQGDWATPTAWFWSFVSTAQGRAELGWAFEPDRPLFGNGFPALIWGELSWPLLVAGLVGVWRLPRRLRWVVVGTLAIYAAFCWLYRFGNWFQVILPAYPLILLGVAQLVQDIAARRTRVGRIAVTLALLGLTVGVGWRALASLPAADSRGRAGDTALDHAALLISPSLPPHAALFAAVDDALALGYLTQIWGIRPDLRVVSSGAADDLLKSAQPVFATADAAPTLLAELTLTPDLESQTGEWIRFGVDASPTTPEVDQRIPITDGVTLVGYTVRAAADGAPVLPQPIPGLDVLLFWEIPSGVWPEGLNLSLRPMLGGAQLTDPALATPIQEDRAAPVYGLWRGDATHTQAVDGYRLPVTGSVDGIRVIVYTADTGGFHNLAVIDLPVRQ